MKCINVKANYALPRSALVVEWGSHCWSNVCETRMRKQTIVAFMLAGLTLPILMGCSSSKNPSSESPGATEIVISSTPPFQTREPERYQTVRSLVRTGPNGESVTRTNVIARDGQARRDEYELAGKKVIYLEIGASRFLMLPDDQTYAEMSFNDNQPSPDVEESASTERLLHVEPFQSKYQKLGNETINGRTLSKFKVSVNTSSSETVSNSETLMWIDDKLGMPIKSETKSADGTRIKMELSDISLSVDKTLFQIPAGYKRIAASDILVQLKGKN